MMHISVGARASRRRRVSGAVAVAAVVSAGVLAGTGPAGAIDTSAYNNQIIGSGSEAAYATLNQIDDLFNAAPGCQIFVPVPNATQPQNLNFSCVTAPTTVANPENPYNDVVSEEPPLGSSNGIQELEDSGAHGATATSATEPIDVFQGINFATSSRPISFKSDLKGLNFVAYAEDGISWFHYSEVASASTPSAAVTNLTQAQLLDIYDGTYTNWDQVGGANAPIVVFSAQEGAGVQSVWKTFLGIDPSSPTNQVNCFTPSGGTNTCVGPADIAQNEDAQISTTAFTTSQKTFTGKKNPDWAGKAATTAELKSDAIYFFSFGDYSRSCQAKKGADCGGSPLGKGTTNALGEVNGVAPSEASILDGQFPVDHYLYNVYSNGSNPNIPAASAATLNYVSEIGFICNPNKGSVTSVIDPNTGLSYLSEIQSAIESTGFFPLSGGQLSGTVNQTPIDEGTVDNPASALLARTSGGQGAGQSSSDPGYAQYEPFDTYATTGPNADPAGYCLTSTSDGDSGS